MQRNLREKGSSDISCQSIINIKSKGGKLGEAMELLEEQERICRRLETNMVFRNPLSTKP